MLKDKIKQRIEGRFEVIQQCINNMYQELFEISASLESLQMLSFFKEDLKENE